MKHAYLFAAGFTIAFIGACCGSASAGNFAAHCDDPHFARQVAAEAERLRAKHAADWFGVELPEWSRPCPIHVKISAGGTGGATSFSFDRGELAGWQMEVTGSRMAILNSTLPHEVLHTVFATAYRQPLPRWADEGSCSTVESSRERTTLHYCLVEFLKTQRGIPFAQMFAMKDYPPDVLPIYAQGQSVVAFLVEHGGRQRFAEFVGEGLSHGDWPRAVNESYAYASLAELQDRWLAWFKAGSPLAPRQTMQLTANDGSGPAFAWNGRQWIRRRAAIRRQGARDLLFPGLRNCPGGNCPRPGQRRAPTAAPSVSAETPPPPAPSLVPVTGDPAPPAGDHGSTDGVSIDTSEFATKGDLQAVQAQLADVTGTPTPGPPGPPGPKGDPGPPGNDGASADTSRLIAIEVGLAGIPDQAKAAAAEMAGNLVSGKLSEMTAGGGVASTGLGPLAAFLLGSPVGVGALGAGYLISRAMKRAGTGGPALDPFRRSTATPANDASEATAESNSGSG